MQPSNGRESQNHVAAARWHEIAAAVPCAVDDRRERLDRRRRLWWSVMYGSFNPRRRRPSRRRLEARYHSLDWHDAHLLAVAIGILLLSAADALMTVQLLSGGADEVNPIMAAVIYKSAAVFATVKMTLTGLGVIVMVVLARYRFMRMVRVDVVMYAVLLAYTALLSYEFWMLRKLVDPSEILNL
ncbi:MAG TPA: DUF5658 family protein [Steroidobacteraceae bacterium]|nr:DUF5658 family protein [Steroidobacteraceae bacterium]